MTSDIFIDSNVWIYLFAAEDDERSRVARNFVADNAANRLIVSYQVVNEVCCVLKRKGYDEPEIRRVTAYLTDACEVCGFSTDIALSASELREKHSFSYWDGHIVAAALATRADLLVSEDMQDGRTIEGLTIKNIFAKRGL